MLKALTMLALMSATAAGVATPPDVAAFVRDHHLTRYRLALTDLNGDGRPEALVYAIDAAGGGEADMCGSGGCILYVLSSTKNGYRQVASISIARPPIRVLPTTTHGWRDLAVLVAGGGIVSGYEARLRFNGSSYPSNPSMSPATHLKGASGTVMIAEPSLKMIRSTDRVIDHLDLTSFPNSVGPRRAPGKKSFADYGFTEVELTPDGAKLYQPDHGWMMTIRILKSDASAVQVCFSDTALGSGSYNAQSALVVAHSDRRWWKAAQIRGGFPACSNSPSMPG